MKGKFSIQIFLMGEEQMISYKSMSKILFICILLFLISCFEEDKRISEDRASINNFIVDNQSSATLRLKYLRRPDGPGEETYSPDIQVGNSETFLTLSYLGGGLLYPSYVIEEINIYTVAGASETLVYTQNPIDDSLWSHTGNTVSANSFTLTLTNSDLGL